MTEPTMSELLDAEPTVFEAWSAVMGDVQFVSKDSRNKDQGFNFRGIDAVMSAVGPPLRRHRVTVIPTVEDYALRQYQTRNGTTMTNYAVKVTYRVYGPAGDFFEGVTVGEAADAGDKAMSKAHSVAFRTFLLQALCIPTDEPDPDAESHEAIDPTGHLVERLQAATSAWAKDDARRQVMKDQAKQQGWPDRIGGYSPDQIEAAAVLAERLNDNEDPFLGESASSQNPPVGSADAPPDPSTANADGQADEQDPGDASQLSLADPGSVNEQEDSDA